MKRVGERGERREELQSRCPGTGSVDEMVGEIQAAAAAEDRTYEEEGAVCGHDFGRRLEEVVHRQDGAVDEAAGEGGRIGDQEGHFDGVAIARLCPSCGLVAAATAHVHYRVEEDRLGKGGGFGLGGTPRGGAGGGGGGGGGFGHGESANGGEGGGSVRGGSARGGGFRHGARIGEGRRRRGFGTFSTQLFFFSYFFRRTIIMSKILTSTCIYIM